VKIEGRETVKSDAARVWEALDGTDAYKACMPAITRLNAVSPDLREATIDLKLPAISGVFDGSIEILERDQPRRVQLRIEGSGKPGVLNGTAEIVLQTVPGGTQISYSADVQVGGQIARLGQRLIGAAAREMAVEFFGNLDTYLGTGDSVSAGNPFVRLFSLMWRTLRGLFRRHRRD
jgi:uncharacterized protein